MRERGTTMRRMALAVAVLCVVAAACEPPMPPSVAPLQPGQQPLRVLVVGDSFALSAGLGLDHYGTSSGQLKVLNAALVGCGFGRGGRNRGIGLDRAWSPECAANEARLTSLIGTFHPDVVLCAGGMWDVTDRQLAGSRTWTHIGVPAYDWYLALELQHFTRVMQQQGARVVWTTAPTWNPRYDPANFMGKPPYLEAKPGRSDRYNVVLSSAVGRMPNVSVLDLAGYMRSRPGGEFSPDLRVDGVHFTNEGTDRVANAYLGPWVVAIGRA
ncbi:MAG: SGNH/GDSL hydrolase family protein [Acidimicrobiales bacterium]